VLRQRRKEKEMSNSDPSNKVLAMHLERCAYVYVRQSSYYQVEHNLESQRRQYNMRKWASELGWPEERIIVVDEDQGRSGSVAGMRSGFEQLASAVGREEVGIVLSLEASRLARNSPDWHHLIYVCRWTQTLLGDEHGIYDPADGNDRMVLGIRGQMSEMELETSIHRMVEGRNTKALRGELMTIPPAGYEVDELEQLVMTSDEKVQHAIRTVFSKFDELGTARQVFLWWLDNGLKFPVRRCTPRIHPVIWAPVKYQHILSILNHPIYAGAYAFGRSQTVREIDPDDPRRLKVRIRRVQNDKWLVLIKDHHPAYISYEKYLKNRARIEGNAIMVSNNKKETKGAAREGRALLQGLVRCGKCGRRMIVSYGGSRPSKRGSGTPQYRCGATRRNQRGNDCQIIGGRQIDRVVVQAFLEATSPAGIEAAVLADEALQKENDALERYYELEVERAEYEAKRAERQYNATEPENRLVARELERRWNARLQEVEEVRTRWRNAQEKRRPLSSQEIERARQLGGDLEAVWSSEATKNQDRKRLLRCAIEEVQLSREEERYRIRIVWKGGLTTEHEAKRNKPGKWNVTPEEIVELVRKLAQEFDDTQIARVLNKQGRRSGTGSSFTKANIGRIRRQHGIPAAERITPKDPREGPFTADEAAAELGISGSTVHLWLREGVLAGTQITPGAPWRIVLTEDIRRRLSCGDAPPDWVGLTEASRRLGLAKSHVAYLVKTGKLKAVRTKVGKRTCWRIDVSSGDCGVQTDLFDQNGTEKSKEA
jgi:DNA invertase Pin-like site-specific DNA recombinase